MDDTVFGVRAEVVNRDKMRFYLIGLIVLLSVSFAVFFIVRKYFSEIAAYENRMILNEQCIQKELTGRPVIIMKDGVEKEVVIKNVEMISSNRFVTYMSNKAVFLMCELVLSITLILIMARLVWLYLHDEEIDVSDCKTIDGRDP